MDIMEENLERYTTMADAHNVRLRSHAKTHKIPDLAHRQHERTGGGIVCQTLSECEVMAINGIDDIYLSYQVVGERKLERLVSLANKVSQFATTVDGPDNILPLQRVAKRQETTVDVILEIDIGYGRTGLPAEDDVAEMALLIADQSHLNFQGVMVYEAHVKQRAETEGEYERLCRGAMNQVEMAVTEILDSGLEVPEVKVGGTATSPYSSKHSIVTEINPGQYLFNDAGEIEYRPWAVSKENVALTVVSTTISKQNDEQVIVDAGSKSISMDIDRQPLPMEYDDIAYFDYSEEHGHIDTKRSDRSFAVGDRLEFIPPHICPTVNFHDTIYGHRDGIIQEIWDVQARGKVQ